MSRPRRTGAVVVIDFDGTLTQVDVGDALCDRFAPPEWRAIDERWLHREISLPEAQRSMWGLVRGAPEGVAAYAEEIGTLRPGAEALLDAGVRGEIDLVLASGGFDFYIDRILADWIARGAFVARWANALDWTGDRCAPRFPHTALGCATCAVCKAKVIERHRGVGRQVLFVGDGSSDACAAPVADRVFAVEGGLLARSCVDRSIEHRCFRTLDEVLAAIS